MSDKGTLESPFGRLASGVLAGALSPCANGRRKRGRRRGAAYAPIPVVALVDPPPAVLDRVASWCFQRYPELCVMTQWHVPGGSLPRGPRRGPPASGGSYPRRARDQCSPARSAGWNGRVLVTAWSPSRTRFVASLAYTGSIPRTIGQMAERPVGRTPWGRSSPSFSREREG